MTERTCSALLFLGKALQSCPASLLRAEGTVCLCGVHDVGSMHVLLLDLRNTLYVPACRSCCHAGAIPNSWRADLQCVLLHCLLPLCLHAMQEAAAAVTARRCKQGLVELVSRGNLGSMQHETRWCMSSSGLCLFGCMRQSLCRSCNITYARILDNW